jgi:hypothetical protein
MLMHEGVWQVETAVPSGAEARLILGIWMYGLKPVSFN